MYLTCEKNIWLVQYFVYICLHDVVFVARMSPDGRVRTQVDATKCVVWPLYLSCRIVTIVDKPSTAYTTQLALVCNGFCSFYLREYFQIPFFYMFTALLRIEKYLTHLSRDNTTSAVYWIAERKFRSMSDPVDWSLMFSKCSCTQ